MTEQQYTKHIAILIEEIELKNRQVAVLSMRLKELSDRMDKILDKIDDKGNDQ